MSELEALGLQGPSFLRNLLTTCSDPIEAIQSFQADNGIAIPSLDPALKLLDLHGVPRADFHTAVLSSLQERLLSRVRSQAALGDPQGVCRSLLEKSFPLVGVAQVRPVVLECLRLSPEIPAALLSAVAAQPQLYADVAIEVKQQIWLSDLELFGREVETQVTAYRRESERSLRNIEVVGLASFLRVTGKARRNQTQIKALVALLGSHLTLYDHLLQNLRQRFLADGSGIWCSLRYDLLMALHDNDVKALIEVDPCHAFAWCLDPCLRERHLDPKHAQELRAFLDRKREAALWGDVAMIAAAPHVRIFVGEVACLLLQQSLAEERLPRDNATFSLALRLLWLGAEAPRIMSGEEALRELKVDPLVTTKFLPSLMALMAQDKARTQLVDKLADPKLHQIDPSELLSGPPKAVCTFVASSSLCGVLWLLYALELGKGRDWAGLTRAMRVLGSCRDAPASQETLLQQLLARLIGLALAAPPRPDALWEVAVSGWLGPAVAAAPSLRPHLLRLAYQLGERLPDAPLRALLEDLDPIRLRKAGQRVADEYGSAFARLQQRLAAAPTMEEDAKRNPSDADEGLDYAVAPHL